jgi:succinyl-diaminopimelate desuccinylase
MKAGCVASLAAARVLLERGLPFSLLFTTDEETAMLGVKALASSPVVKEASAVVVGEPTGLQVIASEKGILWYRATVRGRSAHGSVPHLGDNAIARMARVVSHLEPLSRPQDVLKEITVSLGLIRGGSAPNVVADTCSVDLDCRHPPGTTRGDVEVLLRKAFAASGEAVSLELFHDVPAAGVPLDAPHIRLLQELAGAEVRGVTYGTEMAYFVAHNPRCAVFGPGDPQRIHVPDEHVSLSETVRAAEILAEYGTMLASSSRGSRGSDQSL